MLSSTRSAELGRTCRTASETPQQSDPSFTISDFERCRRATLDARSELWQTSLRGHALSRAGKRSPPAIRHLWLNLGTNKERQLFCGRRRDRIRCARAKRVLTFFFFFLPSARSPLARTGHKSTRSTNGKELPADTARTHKKRRKLLPGCRASMRDLPLA